MSFTVIVCTVLIIHAIGVVQLVMVKEGKREGYSFSDSFGVLSFLLPILTVVFSIPSLILIFIIYWFTG